MNEKLAKFICQPCVKFITLTTSYVILVIMVIYSNLDFPYEVINYRVRFSEKYPLFFNNFSYYVHNKALKYQFHIEDFYLRRSDPSQCDIVLSIWIFCLIVNEFKQIYLYGFKDYFLSWSNIVKSIMYTLFVASFGLKYYTMIMVSMQVPKLDDVNFWNTVVGLKETDISTQIDVFQTFYWLNTGN